MSKALVWTAILLAGFFPVAGWALSVSSPSTRAADSAVVQVYEGCGPYGHRGPYGGCRPGGQWGGYVPGYSCPPGWHIGQYGQRCWPNR